MFFFGTGQMLADLAVGNAGSSANFVLDVHPDEMSARQIKYQMVVLRMAYMELMSVKYAEVEAVGPALDIVLEAYDDLFERMCQISERFRKTIKSGKHKYLGGHALENRNKYWRLAGIPVPANEDL